MSLLYANASIISNVYGRVRSAHPDLGQRRADVAKPVPARSADLSGDRLRQLAGTRSVVAGKRSVEAVAELEREQRWNFWLTW
jgi:hypothetical protein